VKVIVPVVLVKVTVAVSTVEEKVAPPELVMVSVPISVPTAPDTVTAPVTFIVRLDAVPAAVPDTLERFIAPEPPVPRVKVTPSDNVAAPSVIVPDPAESWLEPVTDVVLLRFMAALVDVMLPLIVLEPAVWVTPPVKVRESPLSPNLTAPVVPKLTLLVTSVVAPYKLRSKLPPASVMPVAYRLPLKAMVPVVAVSTMELILSSAPPTAPEKVAPPELVMVSVPISVPIAPDTSIVLRVLNVTLEAVPPVVPVIVVIDIGVAAPAPMVRVTPSDSVTAPVVIWPVEVPPMVEEPVTEIGLFRFMTPVPAAVTAP